MKVLVINSGSSSLKYQLIDMETEGVIAKGNCERIGIDGSKLIHKAKGQEVVVETAMPDHNVAVALVLKALTDKETGVIASMEEIDAVGHRVVASGEAFKKPTLVTEETMQIMEEIKDLAPLHNPAAIIGVTHAARQCRTRLWAWCSIRVSISQCPITRICTRLIIITMINTKSVVTVRTAQVINSYRKKRRNI